MTIAGGPAADAQGASPRVASAAVVSATELVDLAARAAAAYQRPDLSERMSMTRRRLSDPASHVVVVGEFKQGKSSLVNSLLQAPICPVDDDIATAVPTVVRWSPGWRAQLVYDAPDSQPGEPERIEVPMQEVASHITEAGNTSGKRRPKAVEIGVPRPILERGLVIVDTPGVGGLGSMHSAATLGALPMADALVFVTDASQELSQPEMDFLATARDLCPNVTCVITKTDFYPQWRLIQELDRGHLEARRVPARIIAVSSLLHDEAVTHNDPQIDAESGFPLLIDVLDGIVADAERLSVAATAATIASVARQLESQFRAERQALVDPARAQALMGRLQAAKEQAEQLRSSASRWQQTLADGITDLTSDVDHDLRARTREAIREAEEAIDKSDPVDTWDEFEPWLYRRVAEDAAHNYALLHARAAQIADSVSEHFKAASNEVAITLDPGSPAAALEQVRTSAGTDLHTMGIGQQGMTVMKGGYGGVMMFGMLGQSLAGLAMVSPITLAIGLVMGRGALRSEKDRQKGQRRAQAKNAVRRYVDEASFSISKDSRDTLRRIQRQLRDQFGTLADELHRSTSEALQAAQRAASGDEQERARRLRDVDAELARIRALRERATALAPELSLYGI